MDKHFEYQLSSGSGLRGSKTRPKSESSWERAMYNTDRKNSQFGCIFPEKIDILLLSQNPQLHIFWLVKGGRKVERDRQRDRKHTLFSPSLDKLSSFLISYTPLPEPLSPPQKKRTMCKIASHNHTYLTSFMATSPHHTDRRRARTPQLNPISRNTAFHLATQQTTDRGASQRLPSLYFTTNQPIKSYLHRARPSFITRYKIIPFTVTYKLTETLPNHVVDIAS